MEKLKVFFLGVVSTAAVFIAITAIGQTPPAGPLGRYQPVASTGTLFVVDTATGTTKAIWSGATGWAGQLGIAFNNLPNAPASH